MKYLIALIIVASSYGQKTASCPAPPPPPTTPDWCTQPSTGLPALTNPLMPHPPTWCVVPSFPTLQGNPIAVTTAAALQAALTTAQCGTWIQPATGVGLQYVGNFTIPALACPASSPVLLAPTGINGALLPQWVVPPASLDGTAAMVTLVSPSSLPTLALSDGAANWYIAGLEVTNTATAQFMYPILSMGDYTKTVAALPSGIVIDRVHVHPYHIPATATGNYVARGIDMNCVQCVVMNSRVDEIKAIGQDTQAIAMKNTTGPVAVLHNVLSATGMEVMADTSCAQDGTPGDGIPGCPVPSDITVAYNYGYKDLAWRGGPAGCIMSSVAGCWDVKNHIEWKHGQRIAIWGNVLETTWTAGQGEAIIGNTFAVGPYVNQDILVLDNIVNHAPEVAAIAGNGAVPTPMPINADPGSGTGLRIMFENNIAADINGYAWGNPGGGVAIQFQNTNGLIWDHMTTANAPEPYTNGLNMSDAPPSSNIGVQLTNSIQAGSPFANAMGAGEAIADLPSPILGGMLFIGDWWGYPNIWGVAYSPAYPPGVSSLAADVTPVPGKANCQNNGFPIPQCLPPDYALVGFVDAAGGVYGRNIAGLALLPTSPYHNAGTDNFDIGANVPAVLAATREAPRCPLRN
jgi:hypothetical protein